LDEILKLLQEIEASIDEEQKTREMDEFISRIQRAMKLKVKSSPLLPLSPSSLFKEGESSPWRSEKVKSTVGTVTSKQVVNSTEIKAATDLQATTEEEKDLKQLCPHHCRKAMKVIILGNSGVGKTFLLRRLCDFDEELNPGDFKQTIGVEFGAKHLRINDNKIVCVYLWDTSGQERFEAITKNFLHGSCGAFLVYDPFDLRSFEKLPTWQKMILERCGKIPIVLIANKKDLTGSKLIQSEKGRHFVTEKKN